MDNKNYYDFLNFLALKRQNTILFENKIVFRNPTASVSSGAEKMSVKEKKETREKIKEQQEKIKENQKKLEKFNKKLEKFFTQKKTFEVKDITDIKKVGADIFSFSIDPAEKRNKALSGKEFISNFKLNIYNLIKKNGNELKKHQPLKVTVNPGGVIDFADSKNKRIMTFDLKRDSFYATKLDQLKYNISKLRERINKKKHDVVVKTRREQVKHRKTIDLSSKFGNLHEAIKDSAKLKGKVKVVKVGGFQVVKFIGKNAGERNRNEQKLKLEDIYNVALLNDYPDSVLRIKVNNPGRGTYEATYHPERGSFYIDGTTERAKIFNNGKIKVLEFKVTPKRSKVPKGSRGLSTVSPAKAEKTRQKARQEAEKQRDFEKDQRKDHLFNKYYDYIFKSSRFEGHKLLQSKDDFKNWSRVSYVIGPILSRPPFNIKSSGEQKKYMELVIQGTGFWDPNWEIQGKDFFKYGGIEYKGGYEKFLEDYKRLTQKYDRFEKKGQRLSDKEMDQLERLEDIAIGIARIYEALNNMKALKQEDESEKERMDRTVLLNVPKATEAELKEINQNRYLNYNLKTLNHLDEKSSYQVNILVGYTTNKKLASQVHDAIATMPTGMLDESEINRYRYNPTKLLFLTYGFDTLVAKGAIKKVDNKRFVLTQIPKDANWARVALKTQAKENYGNKIKDWERVRAKIDSHHKAMNFINAIFSGKETSVENNLKSDWSRLWHWEWAKKKYVSMENLPDVKTYGKNDFNLEAVEKRGYLDLKNQVAERSGETGMFRIPEKNHGKLVRLVNGYLTKGIHMTLANAPKGKKQEVLRQMCDTFGINFEFKDSDAQNASEIVKLISIKGLSTANLTKDQIKFIRLGFLEDRYMKAVESKEMTDEYFSVHSEIKRVQEKLYKQGVPLTDLPRVETDIHAGFAALMQSKQKVTAGGFVGFTLRYKTADGGEAHASAGIGGLKEGMTAHAAIGVKLNAGKLKVYLDAGAGAGFFKNGTAIGAGGSIRIEGGVTPESAHVLGGGLAAGVGPGGIGISLMAYWRYDTEKALAQQINKAMQKFEQIEREPNWEKKVELIRKHPHKAVKQLVEYADGLFKASGRQCPPQVLYFLYKRTKGKIKNAIRLNQKLPWVKSAGVAVGITPVGIGAGLYATIKVPFTEEVVAVRSPVKGFDRYTMEAEAEKELSKKLKSQVTVVKEFELKGENAMLYFDSQLGGKGLARVGMLESSQMEKLSADSSFEQIKKILAKLNIDAKLVPRKPEDKNAGYFIQITPLNTEGSNVELQIDPDLKSKGLILDNQSTPQRILLTASAVKALMITRKRIKFPFQSQGAMNLDIITLKADTQRHTPEIRDESVEYIYKRQGERYQTVKGENTRRIPYRDRNVLTLAAFKRSNRKFEKFDNVQLINYKNYRNATKAMDNALKVLSSKEFEMNPSNTPHLRKFAREWYDLNQNYFLRKLIQMKNPETEEQIKTRLFKKLIEDYNEYRANLPGTKPLSQYEQNMLYALLLDRSFLKIAHSPTPNMPKERIERALKIRKRLFRKYMIKYVNKWRMKYPEAWEQVKKADPNITPTKVANLIALAMPKNYDHMKRMLENPTQIGKDMKFLSYTQKLDSESMPSAYGAANPEAIRKNFFKMFGVTNFKLDALDNRQKAVARVLLNVLSPLRMRRLNNNKERVEFLDSELSTLLISLYDPEKGISPMIEVLGMSNFENLTKLYSAIRAEKDPAKAAELLNNSEVLKSFKNFREMVLKVRNAQLAGKKSAEFNGFKIHFDTELMAGPYLKCSNGTVALKQRFRITTKKTLRVPWKGAKAERSVLVKGRYKKEAAYLTVAGGLFYKPGQRGRKAPPPERPPQRPPGKRPAPTREATAPGGGAATPEQNVPETEGTSSTEI